MAWPLFESCHEFANAINSFDWIVISLKVNVMRVLVLPFECWEESTDKSVLVTVFGIVSAWVIKFFNFQVVNYFYFIKCIQLFSMSL